MPLGNEEPARPGPGKGVGNRSAWLPVALVFVAMLHAVLVPTLLRRTPDQLRSQIVENIEPARRLVRTRQASLAIEVSAYRAYVISRDPQFLERVRKVRATTEELDTQLSALARRIDPETAQAVSVFDQAISEWSGAPPAAEIDLEVYAANLPALQARFEAAQQAAEDLDALLARKEQERDREADALLMYQDLGNAALSIVAVAAVLAVARLAGKEKQARATAEAAVRTRDEVVSIVSHDLRNPLSTVTMAAAFLQEIRPPGDEWPKARKQLDIIRRGTDRMNRMIGDLLDIARIESGRLAVQTAPTAVAPLVEEAAAMLRPAAEKQGQRLDYRVADGLPAVLADHDRLLQIFANLVDNAVKFTPQGGSITLAAEPDGGAVRFRVSDTGDGIPPEHVPHLFDRFWQATRTDRRGIGLGLSIVKALVEAHGGRIAVESTAGQGTTIEFSIPVAAPRGNLDGGRLQT